MKYSKYDAILSFLAVSTLFFYFWWCVAFEDLSVGTNIALGALGVFLYWFNTLVIQHNHIHTPFFKNGILNRLLELVISSSQGMPYILFSVQHMHHHAHSNSLKDYSSTYRYGKNGENENWLTYCLFSPYREGSTEVVKMILKKGRARELFTELFVVVMTVSIWIYLDTVWFLTCFLPVFFMGWFLNSMENYFEHKAAKDPGNRFSNSVSYYGRLYNKLFCNEGYHQEHHIEPQTHWTGRPDVRVRYYNKLEQNDLTISKFPPLLGYLD
jgi:fatty acid desaturase